VEVYRARIDRLAFAPHVHDAYGIGAVASGGQRFRYRGVEHVAPAGSLVRMQPDRVHVFMNGRIVRSGGPELARELEERGYDWLEPAAAAAEGGVR